MLTELAPANGGVGVTTAADTSSSITVICSWTYLATAFSPTTTLPLANSLDMLAQY